MTHVYACMFVHMRNSLARLTHTVVACKPMHTYA